MSFWDASALVSMMLLEEAAPSLRGYWAVDSEVVVWWGTIVECESALARRTREGLRAFDVTAARAALESMSLFWLEITPHDRIREYAVQLVARYDLRAGDALQLAAALAYAAVNDSTRSSPFVTLDIRLGAAAGAEGFAVFP